MTRVLVALLVTGAVAIATGGPNLEPDAKNTLTPIDQVPTKQQIDAVLPNALQSLAAIVTDPDPNPDGDAISIRLRAIHALAKYCSSTPCATGDLAHQSVASVVVTTRNAMSGSDVLLLRAAIETLGMMKVSTDEPTLRVLLDHPSRDIRAATARALRDLCNTQAITSLGARYNVEMTDQVKLAISEALRILSQCGSGQ